MLFILPKTLRRLFQFFEEEAPGNKVDGEVLKEMVRKLSDELEICLEHRLLYFPDPKEFELVKEARDLVKSYQEGERSRG